VWFSRCVEYAAASDRAGAPLTLDAVSLQRKHMPFKSVFIAVVLGTALVLAALLVNAHRPRTERDQPSRALIEAS
jgi:hypothetical protein